MKGNMYVARSSDEVIRNRAESGGAVTSLLKFALESRRVDGVLTIKARDGNRYDGVPVLITDSEELIETAGALHCVTVNIARCLKEYLDGASGLRIAVTCKPCDAKSIIELAKRAQIDIKNLLLIGLNCTGTLLPARAKDMIACEFDSDPSNVIREDIQDGKLTITLNDGTEKERDLTELEEKGYGRRENCRRCECNIPIMADIACGKWGATDKKATFIETCSEKGSEFISAAIEAGYVMVEQPDSTALDSRKREDEAAIELAKRWLEKDFASLKAMSANERYDFWFGHFSQCIKCYGCRDACPICYCKDCILEADRGVVIGGEVPPDVMLFPTIRISHVMDSCINCGQCQDACTVEIPLSRLIFMLNRELAVIFKHEPGMDIGILPPLRTITDEELRMPGVDFVSLRGA
jgi:formate dehydrogenase subunit beta